MYENWKNFWGIVVDGIYKDFTQILFVIIFLTFCNNSKLGCPLLSNKYNIS